MQRGITLVEVMLVIILLAIAVLVILPNLVENRHKRNDVIAMGVLKSCHTAQVAYRAMNCSSFAHSGDPAWQNCYASSFQYLGGTTAHVDAKGNPLDLVPAEITAALSPLTASKGYFFCDIPRDRKGNLFSDSNWRYEFGLSAIPALYFETGTYTLAIGYDGVIYMKDYEKQGTPGQVKQMPDPVPDPTWIVP